MGKTIMEHVKSSSVSEVAVLVVSREHRSLTEHIDEAKAVHGFLVKTFCHGMRTELKRLISKE